MHHRKNERKYGWVPAAVLLICMLAGGCRAGKDDRNMKKDEYLQLQSVYMAGLNKYLCECAGLDDYQEILDRSEYEFPKEKETQNFKAGAFGRKNIYIRNNAYIERLDEEDLKILQGSIRDGEIVFTEEFLDMVKRTMETVLSVRYRNTDHSSEVVYDAGIFQCNMAPGNALVFVISYDFTYDKDGNIVSQHIEDEKAAIVEKLQKKMIDEMNTKLDMPVCVFY